MFRFFVFTKTLVACDRGDEDDGEWEDTDEEDAFDSEGELSAEEDVRGDREFLFTDEETKSRFTEHSLTSSVMRRNEQLSLLDDRFEKVSVCHVRGSSGSGVPSSSSLLKASLWFQFYEQFDDDEIGALDNTEVEGFIRPDSARLDQIIRDYFLQKEKEWVQRLKVWHQSALRRMADEDCVSSQVSQTR